MNFKREASLPRSLVQTSGVRWADTPAAAGPAAQPLAGPAAAAASGPAWAQPGPSSRGEAAGTAGTAAAAAGPEALPQHALERATVTPAGVVILQPPRGGGGGGGGGVPAPNGDHEPPEPSQPGPTAAQQHTTYGISRRNVGYQLLQKAGWTEGTGLGAQEQGRREPLAPAAVRGQMGLGFQTAAAAAAAAGHRSHRHQRPGSAAGGAPAAGAQRGEAAAAQEQQAAAAAAQQAPKRPLPPDPLEKEDTDSKVKRVKQVLQAEADDKAGKAIQRYIYSAFNDATGEPTADSNPLLRRGRTKLSATNPLL